MARRNPDNSANGPLGNRASASVEAWRARVARAPVPGHNGVHDTEPGPGHATTMKRDCPHCHKSLAQKFLRWHKVANSDHSRSCPMCGRDFRFRMYPVEIAVRLLTIAVLGGAVYLAKDRGGGYVSIMLAASAIIAVAYAAAAFMLRDKQRFARVEFK